MIIGTLEVYEKSPLFYNQVSFIIHCIKFCISAYVQTHLLFIQYRNASKIPQPSTSCSTLNVYSYLLWTKVDKTHTDEVKRLTY